MLSGNIHSHGNHSSVEPLGGFCNGAVTRTPGPTVRMAPIFAPKVSTSQVSRFVYGKLTPEDTHTDSGATAD